MTDKSVVFQGELSRLLVDVAGKLAVFLERVLPQLSDDWWRETVLNNLSISQKRQVDQRNITTLNGLDTAGLLKVLDQNWYGISSQMGFTREDRNFVKEMQTVRNRWAHANVEGFPIDDIYRDLDTIQRFAGIIGADDAFIQDVRKTKTVLIAPNAPVPDNKSDVISTPDEPEATTQNHENNGTEFRPGQIVFVKSNPEKRGAVVAVHPGQPENRFDVFMDNKLQMFYASQLQAQEPDANKEEIISIEQFHARLTALQIMHPGLSTLYSLNAARIDFIPYQFRPVLRFIKSDRPRLLIADSVGVGKTIEAGLILRELQARRDIRSVLIICPRPLVIEKKWQNEMKRFEEKFTHLDGDTLRYCVDETHRDGQWPEQHRKTIIPYSLFDETLLHGQKTGKRRKGLLDLAPPPRFDLVIVDEAHRIKNQNTFSHKAVRFFCDNAEAAIFLTATPIQLDSNDLFVLLNMLRPDFVVDRNSFAHMSKPNPYINQAVAAMRSQNQEWQSLAFDFLIQAATTPWGQSILWKNPDFLEICAQLKSGEISNEQRVKMISTTEGFHTFAGIINRTRRRDIGNFTIRKPQTVNVPFTVDQQYLHDELLKIQAEIFRRLHGNINVRFMMTTIMRQAASCPFGLAPFLEGILNRHSEVLDELFVEEADDIAFSENADMSPIRAQIQALLEKARSLDKTDPKLESLRGIINDKQNLPNNKVMLYSSFRHTLNYLYGNLHRDGRRVGLVHGGTLDDERMEIRSRFEKSKEEADALDVLLFSEIGCEGLDYQFCDCIVNYDLPWNPMRVEQRIGRIDRRGQNSESVAIFNLITPGTIDADIYERCLVRIGVFEQAIGDCEEILGEITRGIKNIADNFELTEEERKEKMQQLMDNEIRKMQAQEALEEQQAEFFGIRLPEAQTKQAIADATNFWLSPDYLRKMACLYLQKTCGQDQESILGEKPLKTLRLSQEARNRLLKDFQKLSSKRNTPVYREWENWLKGSNQYLPITFNSDCAMQHPDAAFIMPLHPLVKQAAMSFDSGQKILVKLQATSDEIPAGLYEFAIYRWYLYGIREDLLLKPVASNTVLTESISRILEHAVDCADDMPDISINIAELDTQHQALWNEAGMIHRQKIKELAAYRRESLTASHRARIALLDEQLNQATNENIRRMRQSQIDTAEADYARRIQDLDIAAERADIQAESVAYGVLSIKSGGQNVR